jgi:predicted HTH domain antitoxin
MQIQLTNYYQEKAVTSTHLAELLDLEIRSVDRLIAKHHYKIAEYGEVRFEITPQNKKVYYLNENQALFLGTLSRNSELVVEFKQALVTAYSQARKPRQLSTLDILELATKEIKELQKQNQAKDRVIEDQNVLHASMISMKATESRTTLKALKDDIGVEINNYVNRLYPDTINYRDRHVKAHKLYNNFTGKIYGGAKKASLDSKQDYLQFLKTRVKILDN